MAAKSKAVLGYINGPAAFLAELLANGRNAVAAYRTVFPKANGRSVKNGSYRMVRHPVVQAGLAQADALAREAVERELSRYALDRERLATRLVHFAFTDLHQVAEWLPVLNEEGQQVGQSLQLKPLDQIPPEARAAITKLGISDKGKLTIELPDRRACIMDIARLKGWVTDKPLETSRLVTLKIER